jgi:hypothetical protein
VTIFTMEERIASLRAKSEAERQRNAERAARKAEREAKAMSDTADTHKRRKSKRRSRTVTKQSDTTEFKYRARTLADSLGGFSKLNPGQRWLIRAAVQLGLELETMQAARGSGQEVDLTQLGQLTDRLGRVLQRLGLEPTRDDPTEPVFEPVKVEVVFVEPPPYVSVEPIAHS